MNTTLKAVIWGGYEVWSITVCFKTMPDINNNLRETIVVPHQSVDGHQAIPNDLKAIILR